MWTKTPSLVAYKLTTSLLEIYKGTFQHTKYDKCPPMLAGFGMYGWWEKDDYRIVNKKQETDDWVSYYWEHMKTDADADRFKFKFEAPRSNQSLYESELMLEVHNAIWQVKERWEKRFKEDFENEFEDKLVAFTKGNSPNGDTDA
jgi:hypothetical protein